MQAAYIQIPKITLSRKAIAGDSGKRFGNHTEPPSLERMRGVDQTGSLEGYFGFFKLANGCERVAYLEDCFIRVAMVL